MQKWNGGDPSFQEVSLLERTCVYVLVRSHYAHGYDDSGESKGIER